jgi:hypothetical protein
VGENFEASDFAEHSTPKTCALQFFTWECVEVEGRQEVVPTCPKHGPMKVRSLPFNAGVMFICGERSDHVLNHCTTHQFRAEKAQAEAELKSDPPNARLEMGTPSLVQGQGRSSRKPHGVFAGACGRGENVRPLTFTSGDALGMRLFCRENRDTVNQEGRSQ